MDWLGNPAVASIVCNQWGRDDLDSWSEEDVLSNLDYDLDLN